MKTIEQNFIRTQCGKTFNLHQAAPLASNVVFPFGKHNFIVYKTRSGFYLRGNNTGTPLQLLNAFELISRHEALSYLQLPNSIVTS